MTEVDSNYIQHLLALHQLSEEMLLQAESSNWTKVADIEIKRQQLISQNFPFPHQQDEVQKAQNLAESVYQLNQQLLALGREKLSEYTHEKRSLNNGQKALAAYSR